MRSGATRDAPTNPARASWPGRAFLTGIWLSLGGIVAGFGAYTRDIIDFDGGRYERLAISIARTHSLVPRVNGVNIHSFSQLYPLLMSPFFASGYVPDNFRDANIASAFLMSSACIPAYLLARRLGLRGWVPYAVAALTICMPWIITSLSFMTETAAYPASAWAVYAVVVALAAPSRRHDVLALVAMGAAFLARGELIGIGLAFPIALAVFEIGRSTGSGPRARLTGAARSVVRSHPVATTVYGVSALVALVTYATGELSRVIGIYSVYNDSAIPAWRELPGSLVEHLATFSLGVGILPAIIALAWLGTNVARPSGSPEAHAFACIGSSMALVLFVQSTNFDLVVNSYVHDRFLIYFVPIMLLGAACALSLGPVPRVSLGVPLALIVAGFAFGDIPDVTWQRFDWLDIDSPISTVYWLLARHMDGFDSVRALLIGVTIGATVLFVVGTRFLSVLRLRTIVFGLCAIAMVGTTAAVFWRAFTKIDRNGRSMTMSQTGVMDWIDRAVGPDASVSILTYPISSSYIVSQQRWIDFEFYNKSIQRSLRVADQNPFDFLGLWFPKLEIHFDPETGSVAESPTRWVVVSEKETRFMLAGERTADGQSGFLIDAGDRWRLAWLTFGLYDDGWTRPGTTARMRLYPYAGQRTPVWRTAEFVLRTDDDGPDTEIKLTSSGKTIHTTVTPVSTPQNIPVCVPPTGYGEVRLEVAGSSSIPGDLATYASSEEGRTGGIFIAAMAEDSEVGGPCTPEAQ